MKKKINFDEVLFADRFTLELRKSRGRKWNLLHALHELLFTRFNFPRRYEAEFVFFRCMVREDYKALMHSIASVIDDNEKIIIEDYLKKSSTFAPRAIIIFLKLLPKFFSFKAKNLYERLYLYLRLCFYYRHLVAISKFKFDIIVFFADMQPVENLLAQFYRDKGKKTVTLQHGLYVDYGSYETVNIINYLHQPSEYFLAWGRSTAELIERSGLHRKTVICGKPIVILKRKQEAPKQNIDKESYFSVILDTNIFEAQNVQMLKMLADYAHDNSIKMNVRYHPYNNTVFYENLGLEYSADLSLENSTFVVGHTSSMLYEIMLLNIPVFKFDSLIPSLAFPREIVFDSLSRLNEVISESNAINFKKLSTEYIAFYGEESLNKYANFFDDLKNNRTIEVTS